MFYISKLLKFLVSFGARTEMSITIVANVSHVVVFFNFDFYTNNLVCCSKHYIQRGITQNLYFSVRMKKQLFPLRMRNEFDGVYP